MSDDWLTAPVSPHANVVLASLSDPVRYAHVLDVRETQR